MIVEPVSVFFNPSEFGVQGTLAGSPVSGVLDDMYATGAVGVGGMAASQPIFVCATPAVDPIGLTLVVSGKSYLVVGNEPDGTGMSRLVLEEQA